MRAPSPSRDEYVPDGMTGGEALEHVGGVLGCDHAKAFEQIRFAARDQKIRFRSPQEKILVDAGCLEWSEMDALRVDIADTAQRAQFLTADQLTPEMLSWFEAYEICREDVLRLWPAKPERRVGRHRIALDAAIAVLREKYPGQARPNLKLSALLAQLNSSSSRRISERTLRRALTEVWPTA